MTQKDYLTLQIGMFITEDYDVDNPENYSMVTAFNKGQVTMKKFKRFGLPSDEKPVTKPFKDIHVKQKLFSSEYYSLSREYNR